MRLRWVGAVRIRAAGDGNPRRSFIEGDALLRDAVVHVEGVTADGHSIEQSDQGGSASIATYTGIAMDTSVGIGMSRAMSHLRRMDGTRKKLWQWTCPNNPERIVETKRPRRWVARSVAFEQKTLRRRTIGTDGEASRRRSHGNRSKTAAEQPVAAYASESFRMETSISASLGNGTVLTR